MFHIQVKIKGNKTWTPLVAAFLHIHLHEQSSFTQSLKLPKPTHWNNPKHTQITPLKSPNGSGPFKSSATIPIIYKTYSPMRIPQPIKISKSIPKQSHKPKLRDLRSLNSKSSAHFVVCHPPSPYFSSIQNQLVLRGWASPWGLMGAQT